MTTGYNVVDSCVLFIFSFSSLLLVPPRYFFLPVYCVFFFLSNITLFFFLMINSEQILGIMIVCYRPLHSMSRPNVVIHLLVLYHFFATHEAE